MLNFPHRCLNVLGVNWVQKEIYFDSQILKILSLSYQFPCGVDMSKFYASLYKNLYIFERVVFKIRNS